MIKEGKEKQDLEQACWANIESKIGSVSDRLNYIRESRDLQEKSSAGDKYETGRAMMQIEEEKSLLQLREIQRLKEILSKAKKEKINKQKIGFGALVHTNKGKYYLAIGLGKFQIGKHLYYCVSVQSPIGKHLFGKALGEWISFNGNQIQIQKIE